MMIPADHPARHHQAAVGRLAIGISLGRGPAARLQNPRGSGRSLVLRHRQDSKGGPLRQAHWQFSFILHSAAMPDDAAPACAICRSVNRFSLPVSVLGNWVTKSMARGYL